MGRQIANHPLMKRRIKLFSVIVPPLAFFVAAMAAPPQDGAVRPAYFSIATGGTGSSYFPLGSMIATILSHPVGAVRCDIASACGPAGLIAVAVASQSPLASVQEVAQGRVDSAFMPADIASWAYRGTEMFKASGRLEGLRAIANLYPEPIQLVVARRTGVKSPKGLKGRKVAVDAEGSETRAEALSILAAEHLSRRSVILVDAAPERAAALMRERKLDAFFYIGAAPADLVAGLVNDDVADVIPLDDAAIKTLTQGSPYLVSSIIQAGTYSSKEAITKTVGVGTSWVVRASAPDELIYQLTAALWDPSNSAIIERGSTPGQDMELSHALQAVGIPLHSGAARFYTEKHIAGAQRAAAGADAHGIQVAKSR